MAGRLVAVGGSAPTVAICVWPAPLGASGAGVVTIMMIPPSLVVPHPRMAVQPQQSLGSMAGRLVAVTGIHLTAARCIWLAPLGASGAGTLTIMMIAPVLVVADSRVAGTGSPWARWPAGCSMSAEVGAPTSDASG